MTPQERELIKSLVVVPGRGRRASPEEVVHRFGASDGHVLGLDLLRDAVQRQDATDLEMAFIACRAFGVNFTVDHLGLLQQLSVADWHCKHEDVVTALGELRSPKAVHALYQATQWIPKYLEFDENRALAVKAIWALGNTPGDEAQLSLVQLLESDSPILRAEARKQLERRKRLE